MALVVEDGTGVAGANTYADLVVVREYATDLGLTVPAEDSELSVHVFRAMEWFELHEFPHTPKYTDGLKFPREDEDTIPQTVVKLICAAAATSVDIPLLPQYAGNALGDLKKKKLDVMEREYYASTYSSSLPQLTKLDAMILPLLGGFGLGSGRLQTLRV